MKNVTIPATTLTPETTVQLADNGHVFIDGRFIGVLMKGEYGYSPKAAGHGGRIVRYHTTVEEWTALRASQVGLPSFEQFPYRGGNYPSHYRKNSRKAALAYLVASDLTDKDERYFVWSRS